MPARRRLWRCVYHVGGGRDLPGHVQIVQFRFEHDRGRALLAVAVLGGPSRCRRRHGVIVSCPGRRQRSSMSPGPEVVRVLNGVFGRRPTAWVVGALRGGHLLVFRRESGHSRPEVVDSAVETAQLATRAKTQTGDEADDERDDHTQNDDRSHCTCRVRVTASVRIQRFAVARTCIIIITHHHYAFLVRPAQH